jgi:glycosyltransferase involved in cell wall biosynthesis
MIFHVTTNFEELGGSEASLVKVLNAYKDEEVLVVSLKTVSQRIISLIENSNIEYISLNIFSIKSLFMGCFNFLKLVNSRNPKYIYAWMYHANFFCSFSKFFSLKKFLLVWGVRHSLDDLKGEKRSIQLLIYTGRFLKFTAHEVFYCSLNSLNQHVSYGYSNKKNSVYVPNGYPQKKFNFKHLGKDLVIGYAGRFHEAKDLPVFFSACNLLLERGFSLNMSLCGRGICRDNTELVNIIINSGVDLGRVSLLGEQKNMAEFYSSIDIFVLPSKTEGFPNVLAEAILCSVPSFSTDVGDSAVIINNHSYISPVKNADLLVSNIEVFLAKSKVQRHLECKAIHDHVSDRFSLLRFTNCYQGK